MEESVGIVDVEHLYREDEKSRKHAPEVHIESENP